MDFPIIDLMDEDTCYQRLVDWLHPDGLRCPRCHRREGLHVHRRHRAPVLDYRCYHCGRVFNAFTGTSLHGIRRRPSELVLILRGIAQGTPTAQLARELDCDRAELLRLRHRLQDGAYRRLDPLPLEGPIVEADEMYQNAGEKRGAPSKPGRSAPAAGQQGQRAGHLAAGPSADFRGAVP
jgi:transposase-like protein